MALRILASVPAHFNHLHKPDRAGRVVRHSHNRDRGRLSLATRHSVATTTGVAAAYDREVNTAINRSMAVLEPLMIVGMAVVVGFIVFAIMQPIIQMNSMANL